ncbi:hypothetical protein PspS34_09000 [Pseudomonas sp. S34]|uniref:polysaccharide pyruvyl transferase family protein n=1 Tax=Pseudomonas sp. S34 TaxID=1573718 RepID=UPI00132F22DE|nr:polysaccharide pyruvyl transferase family protein [Pseudomonas sp. S34]QHF38395.1 hypothetical protein PspS34_09000 [Pseudomonas sp. S34]
MKKIGLLTLPLKNNYGGILQAVALYSYLSKNHNVKIIQKNAFRPTWKRLLVGILELIPLQNFKNHRSNHLKNKHHKSFIKKHLPNQTSPINNVDQLKKFTLESEFDAIIVGSDQVWRMDYIDDGSYSAYFLDFIENPKTKKISYAASFGKDHWQAPEKIEEVTQLLKGFDAISTRETVGVDICREVFNSPRCEHVLDPTLLVEKSFFEALLVQPVKSSKKILLNYTLDQNKIKNSLLTKTLDVLGESYEVSSIYEPQEKRPKFNVQQWIGHFSAADFVITDSFHGMVFSIIFNKNFLVVANKDRGLSRFSSLLNLLSLESRLITEDSQADIRNIVSNAIDYSDVEITLSQLRAQSKQYLEDSLR